MVKNDETGFFRKILIFGESQKTGQIFFYFLVFTKTLIHYCLFCSKNVFYDSTKAACLGKIWSFIYGQKCSKPIRLKDIYLIIL